MISTSDDPEDDVSAFWLWGPAYVALALIVHLRGAPTAEVIMRIFDGLGTKLAIATPFAMLAALSFYVGCSLIVCEEQCRPARLSEWPAILTRGAIFDNERYDEPPPEPPLRPTIKTPIPRNPLLPEQMA